MRDTSRVLGHVAGCFVAGALVAGPAAAAHGPRAQGNVARYAFRIPAGPLTKAIIAIGSQAGVSIATTDPSLARHRLAHPVDGRMTVEEALARVLQGSGLRAICVSPALYRIERIRIAPPPPASVLARLGPPLPPSPPAPAEIVVTATKSGATLHRYPGSAWVVDADALTMGTGIARDSRAIVAALPVLSATHLGPGREKLFVRGIADSSFTGASQATVGQYLGDVQLNYSAPDPNLALYDMARVELLEGPQGTLYGAGALGGIVRLTPRAPKPGVWEGEVSASTSAVAHGGIGGNAMVMLNAPFGDRMALRLVGYGGREPGYIDDVQRNLQNINRSSLAGGRATLRLQAGNDWTVDLGAVYQRLYHYDGQYSEADEPPLSRAAAIAQPALNDFRLAHLTATHRWADGQTLTAAFSVIENHLTTLYDASSVFVATGLATDNRVRVYNGEVRLARRRDDGTGLILGAYGTVSDDRMTQSLKIGGVNQPSRGVGNRATDAALFGELTFRILDGLNGTVGARAAYTDLQGTNILPDGDQALEMIDVPGTGNVRFLPSAALSWAATPRVTAYLRYQRGYRLGGYVLSALSPQETTTTTDADFTVYRPDSLDAIEAGLRLGEGRDGLSSSLALSTTNWRHIQADLQGFAGPVTANIGSGRIAAGEASLQWRAPSGLRLAGTLFVTRAVLDRPAPGFERTTLQALPNTPAITLRGEAERQWTLDGGSRLLVRGTVRYVGRSWLGVGDLHIPQGNFGELSAGAAWSNKRLTLTLDIANLMNSRANRFSLGNPLTVDDRNQRTPQQPRTLMIGAGYRF